MSQSPPLPPQPQPPVLINYSTVAKCFLEFNYNCNDDILDLDQTGTGILGQILSKNGYKNVDGILDVDGGGATGSPTPTEFADQHFSKLKECNFYRNLYRSSPVIDPFDKQSPLDSSRQKYEAVILADIFCSGLVDIRSFEKVISITKSGGFICWSMDDPKVLSARDPQFAEGNFDRYIAGLCDKCKWLSVLGYPLTIQNYRAGQSGLFYAMQNTGSYHTLLLSQMGEVYTCGRNDYGQLGRYSTVRFSSSLSKVLGLSHISQIAFHPSTNMSIAMSSDACNKRCFVRGELPDQMSNFIPQKLPPIYSSVQSPLSFFSTVRNTLYSVTFLETPSSSPLSATMSRMFGPEQF